MSRHKIGKHKTMDKDVMREFNWLQRVPHINKVVLGRCDAFVHHFGRKVKIVGEIPGGIQLKFYIEGGTRPIFLSVEKEHSADVLMTLKLRYDQKCAELSKLVRHPANDSIAQALAVAPNFH